jgi:hypothetical protein
MELIVEVTSDDPARALSKLLTISLGLDSQAVEES